MLKIGVVDLHTDSSDIPKRLNVIWYIDKNSNARIDVIENAALYKEMDTSECIASIYRVDNKESLYGSSKVIKLIDSIRNKSVFLPVPEKKDVKVEGKKFIMNITKSDDSLGVSYKVKMVSGRIVEETFSTTDGTITFNDIRDIAWDAKFKPINWSEYEQTNDSNSVKRRNTIKTEQAEFYSYEELLRKYPEVMHVLSEENDYKVIRSYEEAVERLNIWINSKEQLKSIDIESVKEIWGQTIDNQITGVFLGFGEHWSTYFPFRQQNFKYNLPEEFLRQIFDAVNNQPPAPEVIILSHNAKFEIQGFYKEFTDYIRIDYDTYLAAVLANPIIKKGSHTLKTLTGIIDKKFYLSLEHIFIGQIRFNVLTEDIVLLYGCPDATSPAKLFKYLESKIPADETFIKNLEFKLPYIKAMNEYYGMRMDQELLDKLVEEEEFKSNTLSEIFKKIHHTSRNINSNDVLSDIIYNRLRCPVEVRTDKGQPSTSKFAIDRIIDLGTKKIEEGDIIPKDILDRNGKVLVSGESLAKNRYPSLVIYQTYKKSLKELGALRRLKNKSIDGFFKFYINQVGAGSNRQTSDAHQFSDTMKQCALADSPYHGLVSCDYKQVELRVLAGVAGEEPLIELERDPNIDIHRAILSIIKKKPIWAISEEERKLGKTVNFGVVYMMTEYGLARRDYGPAYTKAELNEERQRIMDFFNGLPMIKKYLKGNELFLKEHGYIKTVFNYYRYFPELLDPTLDSKLAQSLVRSGNNTPVQGAAATLLKLTEVNIWNYIRKKGWDKVKNYDGRLLPMVRMILPIHDEILLSYDKSIPKEEIILMFKECMELDIDGMPPFFAAPAFINNWYEGKNPTFEVDIPFRDEVVRRYVEEGKLTFDEDNYVKVLTEYRNGEIKDYMEEKIAMYKTVEEVAKHITDDSLTHTLIETLIPDKGDRKKLTHEERILEATRRYMENLDKKGLLEELQNKVIETVPEDDERMDVEEWSSYVYTDSQGNLIEEAIEDAEYYDNSDVFEELAPLEERDFERPNCIYLIDECLIDLTNIPTPEQAEEINQRLQDLCEQGGYYKVVFIQGYKTVTTPFKIGYIPDSIDAIFKSVLNNGNTMNNVNGVLGDVSNPLLNALEVMNNE